MKIKKILNKTEISFILTVLILGVIYSYIYIPFKIPDEGTHFYTSYALANKILGQDIIKSEKDYRGIKGVTLVKMKIRECDLPLFEYQYYDDSISINIKEGIFESDQQLIEFSTIVCTYFPFPTYIVDAIIIILGFSIKLSALPLVYFVRYINLCVYVCIGIICIRMLPFAKELMYVLFALPFGIERAMSAGHESLYFAYVWFYISYIIYLAYKKDKLEYRDIVILTVLSMLISPIKGLGIFLIFLILLVKKKKFPSEKIYKIFLGICFIGSVFIWLGYNINSLNLSDIISSSYESRYIEYSNRNSVYILDIIKNPLPFLKIIGMTFLANSNFFMGCMNNTNGSMGSFVTYGFAGLFFMTSIPKIEDEIEIPRLDRYWILFIFLVLYSMLCILTIITFGGEGLSVAPIKSTYIMPYLPLFGFMLRWKLITYNGKNQEKAIVVSTAILHLMGILYILMRI